MRRAGVGAALGVELRKLVRQGPIRILILVSVLGPFAYAAVLKTQAGVPADSLFGIWVHESGFASPLVILSFAGSWGLPVLAGILAGDICSSEDRHGTWKLVLTRAAGRRQVFTAKVAAAMLFALGLIALLTVTSLLAGVVLVGTQPIVSLGGTLVQPGHAVVLVLLSWATTILPTLAFVSLAILFSVATRNGIAGVLGPILVALAMLLLGFIGGGYWVHTWLAASAYDAWHGLVVPHPYLRPLLLGGVVSLAWIAVALGAAWSILRGRDFAGAPVGRRRGWVTPVVAVLGTAAAVGVLAAASNLGPAAVTANRLTASLKPTFEQLTIRQQLLLGRSVPRGAHLRDYASCVRRSGATKGPGEDWVCTVNLLVGLNGPNPFSLTPVAFDVSVKANGCYKAQGPPSFIGQPQLRDSHGRERVNPLYQFDGCFDVT